MFRLIPVPEECWAHEEFREVMQLDAEVRIRIHGVSVHPVQLCCTSVKHISCLAASLSKVWTCPDKVWGPFCCANSSSTWQVYVLS